MAKYNSIRVEAPARARFQFRVIDMIPSKPKDLKILERYLPRALKQSLLETRIAMQVPPFKLPLL